MFGFVNNFSKFFQDKCREWMICISFVAAACFSATAQAEWIPGKDYTATQDANHIARFEGTSDWAYPEWKFTPPCTAKEMSFEIRFDQQSLADGYNNANVIFYKVGAEKVSYHQFVPRADWQTVVIDLDKRNLTPLSAIRIGYAPKNKIVGFEIRNLGFDQKTIAAESLAVAPPDVMANLFIKGRKVEFSLKKTIPDLHWTLKNWREKTLAEGTVTGDAITLPVSDYGYYYLFFDSLEYHLSGMVTFAVIPEAEKYDAGQKYPYSIASMTSCIANAAWVPAKDRFQYWPELMRRVGFKHYRDSLHWRDVEKTEGTCDYSRHHKNFNPMIEKELRGCAVSHSLPPWRKNETNQLPKNLLETYRFHKESAAEFKNIIFGWEFWNEPDLGKCEAPSWEFVSNAKAAYLGIKAGNPDCNVLSTSGLYYPAAYCGSLYANDYPEYFDVLNIHVYKPYHAYERFYDAYISALGLGAEGKNVPVYVTESGLVDEGDAYMDTPNPDSKDKRHSPIQEMLGAELAAKSNILLQNLGVDRNYLFTIPPYNERGGKKDWGFMRKNYYTAKPALPAISTLIQQLGKAEPQGEVTIDSNARAFLYRQPNGSQTIVYWSKSEGEKGEFPARSNPQSELTPRSFPMDLTFRSDKDIEIVDLFGETAKVAANNGKVVLPATRFPAYANGFVGVKPDIPFYQKKARRPSPGLDKTIVLRLIPSEGFKPSGDLKTMILNPAEGNPTLNIEVFNFSDEKKRIELSEENHLLRFVGKKEIGPFAFAVFHATFVGEVPASARLVLSGTADGKRISRLVCPLVCPGRLTPEKSVEISGAKDPSKWRSNTSGKMEIGLDEEKNVCFTTLFKKEQDKWAYPEYVLNLPSDDLSQAKFLSFEIKSNLTDKDLTYKYIMLVESAEREKGNAVYSNYSIPVKNTWHTEVINLEGFHNIKQIRIGANPKTAEEFQFSLRNLRLIK